MKTVHVENAPCITTLTFNEADYRFAFFFHTMNVNVDD